MTTDSFTPDDVETNLGDVDPEPARLVPDGKDFLRGLTVGELDMASRRVGAKADPGDKCNIGEAVDNHLRWAAFAILADIWARRAGDPRREKDFRELDPDDLTKLLGLDLGDNADQGSDEENPTDSRRESA